MGKWQSVQKDDHLSLLRDVYEVLQLSGGNPFRLRAYEKALKVLGELPEAEFGKRLQAGTLQELDGIGKGIEGLLAEYGTTGKSLERDQLAAELPEGLREMAKIPGLGPKRARQVIEDLDVHTLIELEYACRENRLQKMKGFGEKLQKQVLEGIEFLKSQQNLKSWVDARPVFQAVQKLLQERLGKGLRVEPVGAFARRLETLEKLEILIVAEAKDQKTLQKKADALLKEWREDSKERFPIQLHWTSPQSFGGTSVKLASSEAHWKALKIKTAPDSESEVDFYRKLKLPWIPPESRETGEEVAMARTPQWDKLVGWNDVQGVFHTHTTRSDGKADLDSMVRRARDLGYRYIGISDHSQSAFYARGLKEDDLKSQEKEIRQVQERYPEIRVFWGVESDILQDGSLDYPDRVLKKFDFVIASIHSRFKMERQEMTDRILKAIRHPSTRFIGHLTGRLLLGRKAYDIDIPRLIQEAKDHDVAIEINSHPTRLDIDWRWGPEIREVQMLTSINPDAHSLEGLEDTVHGIGLARKALLPRDQIINTWKVEQVASWLSRKHP